MVIAAKARNRQPRTIRATNANALEIRPPNPDRQSAETLSNDRSFGESLLGLITTTPVSLIDDVSSSLGLTEKNQLTEAAFQDAPLQREFLRDNRGAIEAVTGVGAAIALSIGAGRVFKAGTTANKIAQSIPGFRTIARLGIERTKTLARLRRVDLKLATDQGRQNRIATLLGSVTFKTGRTFNRAALNTKQARLSLAKGAAEGALTEVGLGIFQNENNFLFTDELATNIAFAALGIVLPAGFERLAGNHRVVAFTNSDRISRVAQNMTDVGGFHSVLERASGELSEEGTFVFLQDTLLGLTTNGARTDRITARLLAAQAKRQNTTALTPTAIEGLERAALADLKQAREDLGIVTRDGIDGVANSGFALNKNTTDPSVINALDFAIRTDAESFAGVEKIGLLADDGLGITTEKDFRKFIAAAIDDQIGIISNARSSKPVIREAQAELRKLNAFNDHEVMIVHNGQPLTPREFDDVGQFIGRIQTEPVGAGGRIFRAEGSRIGIQTDGNLTGPVNLLELTANEAAGLFRAGRELIDMLAASATPRLNLNNKASFFEIDLAVEVARKNPNAQINFPRGMTREEAIVESFAQKVDILKSRVKPIKGFTPLAKEFQPTSPRRSLAKVAEAIETGPATTIAPRLAVGNELRVTLAEAVDVMQQFTAFKIEPLQMEQSLRDIRILVDNPELLNRQVNAVGADAKSSKTLFKDFRDQMLNIKTATPEQEATRNLILAIVDGNAGEAARILDSVEIAARQGQRLADVVDNIGLSSTDLALRTKLNLPRLSTAERGALGKDLTAVDQLIKGLKNGDEIRQTSLGEIKQKLAELRKVTELSEFNAREIELSGGSFRSGVDDAGNSIAPFAVVKRPFDKGFYTRDQLEIRLGAQQTFVLKTLSGDEASPLVRRISANIINGNEYPVAIQSSKLNANQLTNTFPGFENRVTGTSTGFQDFRFRNNPVLTATRIISQNALREARQALPDFLKKSGGENVLAKLRDRNNNASSQLFDQYVSQRAGWELSGEVITDSNGFTRFLLQDNSKINADRWALQNNGAVIPTGSVMQFDNGSAVLVDELAFEGLKVFDTIADNLRLETNTLLRANGLSEIRKAPFYVPPANREGKVLGFILDGNGRTVQEVRANNVQELNKEIARLRKQETGFLSAKGHNDGFRFKTQDEIETYNSLFERSQNQLMDSNIPVLTVGKQRTGAAIESSIRKGLWEDALKQFSSQYNRLGRDTLETMFKPQIQGAKARSATEAIPKANSFFGAKKEVLDNESTIHDVWINTLLGKNPLNDRASNVGRIYNVVESLADRGLAGFSHTLQDINPFSGVPALTREYNRLNSELAEKMPFKNVTDFLEQRAVGTTPPSLRKVTGNINKFTAGIVLRWVEIAHPILNFTGTLNTTPSVIRSLTMRPGESQKSFITRVGAIAHIYPMKNGEAVATLDMGKIMHRAFKQMNSKNRLPAFEEELVRTRGFLDQEVSEVTREFASMNKTEDIVRFFEKADRNAGFLSDGSERLSRTYSHFVGLEIAKINGIVNDVSKHNFAHETANRIIANYNPLNRPDIFQGGVGAPLGLFQSYMFNYWQRIYRYVETGDLRNLGLQAAMQGSLFGAVTVPGFRQYNDIMNSVMDGETNPYDGVYNRFPRELADLLMAGVVSSLPKAFGARDGVALFTRGDISPRVPIIGGSAVPAVQIGIDFFNAIGEGINAYRSGGTGLTLQRLTEIAANGIPNRPVSGLLDVFAGAEVDRRGNVVSNDITNLFDATVRAMGFRTISEQKEQEAFFANKRQQEISLAKRNRLLSTSRAMVRSGNFEKLPQVMEEFINSGGQPADFAPWLKQVVLTAKVKRTDRQLIETLSNVDRFNQAIRLMRARN